MSRPNHIVMSDLLIPGRELTGLCGARFRMDKDRNVFEHEDCADCLRINKERRYAEPTKLYPILKRQRPYTSSASTPTDWSI